MNSDLGRINMLANKLTGALPPSGVAFVGETPIPGGGGQHGAVTTLDHAMSELRGKNTPASENAIAAVVGFLECLQPLAGTPK